MRSSTLIKNSLTYYWRTNAAVIFGVAAAVAVLAGALLVGDSVRASLRDLVLVRLGNTDYVVSAPDFFREELADDLQADKQFADTFEAACPLIALEGLVIHQESGRRASGVQVYGVDERFWRFNRREGRAPSDREILVSAALAEELVGKTGDSLLVRVEEPSVIPAESLHGRKEDTGRTVRLTLREALPPSDLGEFSIRPQQGAVRAVFVSLARMQKELEVPGKVNTILLSEKSGDSQSAELKIADLLQDTFALEDLAIKLRVLEEQGCLSLESNTGLIGDALSDAARVTANDSGMRTSSVFTYLANSIRGNPLPNGRGTEGGREVPYSLVTALDETSYQRLKGGNIGSNAQGGEDGTPTILLNDWAASDLAVKAGDPVTLEYYVWLDEGRLVTRTAEFRLDGVVALQGAAADRDLAPDYPGITDSDDVTDWDPPFPVDLSRIRPRDEDYWDKYRATPKAFIHLEKGQELWQSRYGKLTSIRIFPAEGGELPGALAAFRENLRSKLDPNVFGFSVFAARSQGLEASRGATDFGEYFVYFSFFLVVSALMLTALFFKLGVEQRLRQIGLLKAIGFPAARIRNIFLGEAVVLATAGSVLGLGGAVAYGALMMYGLRTWWMDAIGTTLLTLHVTPVSLIIGGVGGVLSATVCIMWTLRRLAPASPRSLLAGEMESRGAGEQGSRGAGERESTRPYTRLRSSFALSVSFTLSGLLLLIGAVMGWVGQAAGFFGAGTSLLVALLCYEWVWLRRSKKKVLQGSGFWPVVRLGFRNATYRPGRSVLCIALIASAAFIIVAVDAFRREGADERDKKSGTGGFPLLAESILPLLHDPNTAEGRDALNLFSSDQSLLEGAKFWRFRVRPGDDASCLNLYQPRNPRVLAPTDDFIKSGRFAFQDSAAETAEEKENPWLLLDKDMGDGAIPVIADANSMTYVLHLNLGDEFIMNPLPHGRGTELRGSGSDEIRLRVVASLSDSIFQGEFLMSEKNFLRAFPGLEGHRFLLLDVPPERAEAVAGFLEDRLSDLGLDAVSTGERLATFHRVENTYLSTFQTLGGLGLLLGTLGLATVLLRNVLERRREIALLRAVGYNSTHFAVTVLAENALLLSWGLMTGAVSAFIAISPAFFARGGRLSAGSLALLLLAVLVTGLTASLVATAAAIRSPLLPALRSE
ncbi:MAG: FtsX-like permease family protein [Blastocatellia bacterium]|nr:FtsX-like permease family protein [Blastocatellia bacterium]